MGRGLMLSKWERGSQKLRKKTWPREIAKLLCAKEKEIMKKGFYNTRLLFTQCFHEVLYRSGEHRCIFVLTSEVVLVKCACRLLTLCRHHSLATRKVFREAIIIISLHPQ
eukprot:TRINITY_DN85_c0_g2_i5.p1 TRINITY_DN85_c0_g2~~TRINITY_DN85_c0_g2_i5.p1  ORF type:complete len:110 (-),score=2.56 TRINITY_DN85_c0_g2_i5:182-511(-)